MEKRRQAQKWRRKALLQDLLTGIVFASLAIAAIVACSWRLAAAAAVTFFLGFILQRMRFRGAVCEQCGAMLRRKPEDDSRIVFHCELCKITWDTKVIQDGS